MDADADADGGAGAVGWILNQLCFCGGKNKNKKNIRTGTKGGDRCVFDKFLVTNSIPTTTDKLPRDDVYVVLDLVSRIKEDLDLHSSI